MVDCFVSVLILALVSEMNANPCGGYIQTLPGSIQTPNYPDSYSYPPNTECTWILEAAEDHNVHVIFIDFDIVLDSTCTGDKVEFKDGSDANSPWIASYCGNISPPNITTTGRYLYIKFVSDETIETTGMYLLYDQVPACKLYLNDSSGFISSPNYPENYPSLTKCVWIINSPYESIIQLTILKLEIEYEVNCSYDSLKIYDGNNDSSPLLGKYCGPFQNEVLNSTSNLLFMEFKSDLSDELRGFNASYLVYSTQTSQVIGSFQNNKSDETQQIAQFRKTTVMDSNVSTSALTIGSSENDFLSTIYDPSLDYSTVAVSASGSEEESEITLSESTEFQSTIYDPSFEHSTVEVSVSGSVEVAETTVMDSNMYSSAFTKWSSDNEFRSIIPDPSLEHPTVAVSASGSEEESETTVMDSNMNSSAFTKGSSDNEFQSTIQGLSLKDSNITVSVSEASEQKSETSDFVSSSGSLSTSGQSETIMGHAEIYNPWTIEIMSSSYYYISKEYSVLLEKSGLGTLISMTQSNFHVHIVASYDEDGESSDSVTFVPQTHSSRDSHGEIVNTKSEQIQPTAVVGNTKMVSTQDELSTETIHHTAVDNNITILLPTVITLITTGIVIGVVCAIKFHVKKIANLKVVPVDHHPLNQV